MPVKVRIEAAEALGRGGDPRLARWDTNLIEIPGLRGLLLAKYPVTVEEYQHFVDARGYEERDYWSTEGWRFKQARKWETPGEWDGQLRAPNRPVVNVSWYEAESYCHWLTESKGISVRLPEIAEWERAAKPPTGEYPWGADEADEDCAIFEERVGAPTPVGIYPAGDGPAGHSDLAGNVWEWCADKLDAADWEQRQERDHDPLRALRGGSWIDPAEALRATYRGRDWAADRVNYVGFRAAVDR